MDSESVFRNQIVNLWIMYNGCYSAFFFSKTTPDPVDCCRKYLICAFYEHPLNPSIRFCFSNSRNFSCFKCHHCPLWRVGRVAGGRENIFLRTDLRSDKFPGIWAASESCRARRHSKYSGKKNIITFYTKK